ncbi:MAG: ATP-binding protein [Phycisphaerales bacterium]
MITAARMAQPSSHPADSASLRLTNRRDDINGAEEALLAALTRHGYGETSKFAVRLAVEEALSNAFHHGHRSLPSGTPVRFEYAVSPAEVHVHIEDQGPGFTPADVPDPTADENLELPSGRGLLLMRAYMTDVEFSGRGNVLHMRYQRPVGES